MRIDPQTRSWWTLLRVVSIFNLLVWVVIAITGDYSLTGRTAHVLFSGIYTLVCAFRSFYPRIDLERTVLVDHWLSSIALGRSAATLAEMCFTFQLALLLIQFSVEAPWLQQLATAIVVIISVAQLTCWCGVLSGNHLWHAAEESLWTLMVIILAIAGIGVWPQVETAIRLLLIVGWIGCAAAVYVMSGLDVPMYLQRWRSERASGKNYLAFGPGFADALSRRQPTGDWQIWRHEVNWMTPYFTLCVWLSLVLARFA